MFSVFDIRDNATVCTDRRGSGSLFQILKDIFVETKHNLDFSNVEDTLYPTKLHHTFTNLLFVTQSCVTGVQSLINSLITFFIVVKSFFIYSHRNLCRFSVGADGAFSAFVRHVVRGCGREIGVLIGKRALNGRSCKKSLLASEA